MRTTIFFTFHIAIIIMKLLDKPYHDIEQPGHQWLQEGMIMDTSYSLLKRVSLFQDLGTDELQQISQITTTQTFEPYESIIKEGEIGDRCYIVVSGQVSATSGGAFLGALGEGSHFGEMALLDNAPRSATIISTTPTTLLVITREDLMPLLNTASSLSHKVLWAITRQLTHRLRHANIEISSILCETLMDEKALTQMLSDEEKLMR